VAVRVLMLDAVSSASTVQTGLWAAVVEVVGVGVEPSFSLRPAFLL
jgi:hypothetical protein